MGHEVYTDFRCFATWCLLAGKRANRSARGGGSAAIANMSIENGRPAIFEAQKLTFTRRKIDVHRVASRLKRGAAKPYSGSVIPLINSPRSVFVRRYR